MLAVGGHREIGREDNLGPWSGAGCGGCVAEGFGIEVSEGDVVEQLNYAWFCVGTSHQGRGGDGVGRANLWRGWNDHHLSGNTSRIGRGKECGDRSGPANRTETGYFHKIWLPLRASKMPLNMAPKMLKDTSKMVIFFTIVDKVVTLL
ncbi:MAG: hypothetical protein WBD67_11760 [Terracidiphilus sp.]